jgi:hypothetical protein
MNNDPTSDWLLARLGRTALVHQIVPVRLQRASRVGLGRDFLREDDRLAAGDCVFTPWHGAALPGPESRVLTRVAGGCLRIGIVAPDFVLRSLSPERDDAEATLELFVANPLHADRLRWREWRRLTAGGAVGCGRTVSTPPGSLEEAFVRRETRGAMDYLVRKDRGLLSPSATLEPWRRFVRVPLQWLAPGSSSAPSPEEESAHWFEIDWPEAEPVDVACDVVLCADQILAKAEAVRSQGTRLGIDKCPDLRGPQRVRILAIWNSETGDVLEASSMPWLPASRRYHLTAEAPRHNEAMVVEVPKQGLYTILTAACSSADLAAGTKLSVHRGNDRLLGGDLVEPTRPLVAIDPEALWGGFVAGMLGGGSLLRPADFVHAIRCFQPFGVADWCDAGATAFHTEARQIDKVLLEMLVLTVPVNAAAVASARDLDDARHALADHLQGLVGRPVKIEVRWSEAA